MKLIAFAYSKYLDTDILCCCTNFLLLVFLWWLDKWKEDNNKQQLKEKCKKQTPPFTGFYSLYVSREVKPEHIWLSQWDQQNQNVSMSLIKACFHSYLSNILCVCYRWVSSLRQNKQINKQTNQFLAVRESISFFTSKPNPCKKKTLIAIFRTPGIGRLCQAAQTFTDLRTFILSVTVFHHLNSAFAHLVTNCLVYLSLSRSNTDTLQRTGKRFPCFMCLEPAASNKEYMLNLTHQQAPEHLRHTSDKTSPSPTFKGK